MEGDGEQGPDAASIVCFLFHIVQRSNMDVQKPVSSLRAKFENLKHHNVTDHDAHGFIHSPTPGGLRPVDPSKQASLTRASLDLPRSHSPWQQVHDAFEHHHAPRTPGPPSRGSESPTRSNHKRPMSMYLGSSPQLTPAVNIESPTSPPKPFFTRAHSRSPERLDTTALGRVRDLVSHHSNSSTRQSSPAGAQRTNATPPVISDPPVVSSSTAFPLRPRSPMPPPVNRADKPKIPAKPRSISPAADVGLTSKVASTLDQNKVSPFNTPPSSDEEGAPTKKVSYPTVPRRSVDILNVTNVPVSSAGPITIDSPRRRPTDPRMMGFSAPKTVTERPDPRQSGFSSTQPQPQPLPELKSVPTPARTVPPVVTSGKDARALGFGASTPVSREPPPLPQTERPLPPRLEAATRAAPARDARMYGFSGTPTTPLDSSRQELPQKLAPKLPPPRPSEDSKRPVYVPGIARTATIPISQPTVAPPVRKLQDIQRPDIQRDVPRQNVPNPADLKFPPPPKRGTFNEDDTRKPSSLSIPARNPSLIAKRSFDMNNDQTSASEAFTPSGKSSSGIGARQSSPDTMAMPGRKSLDMHSGQPDRDAQTSKDRRPLDTRSGQSDSETPTTVERGIMPIERVYDSDEEEGVEPEPTVIRQEYPDGSQSNRRPPILDPNRWQIQTRTDGKVFDICGRLLCTAGYHTRIYDLDTATEMLDLNHGETVKTTAVIFKPGQDIKSEGKRIWIGNNLGELQEIDLETHVTIAQSSAHGRREIIRIVRHHKDLWTLDDGGNLFVWPSNEQGVPNLKYSHTSHKLAKPPTWAMAVQDTLWTATGKEVRVHRPGHESTFDVLKSPLLVQGAGEVTSGTFSGSRERVYLGHIDGKVSIYSLKDYSLIDCIKVSDYKINAMAIVGDYLWAVYKTGKVYVYDVSGPVWKIKKDWKAHAGPATGILLDPSSVWLLGRLQVATTGHDQFVRLWDGLLEDDWVETTMHKRDTEYCTFRDVQAAVTTWNCGATSPALLRTDFIADAIHAHERDPPQILVFGFQEVVDLEDRKLTAKSILGFGKKKDKEKTSDHQHQSRVYREWRDYLASCIRKYIPQHEYTELHTSSLVGLFSCVFVRTNERRNITRDARQEVKCGMGGHYGNKGALLCRFILDSSSLCFVNCHLAAGQSQSSHRNNDVAVILESESLPNEPDMDIRTSLFVGGGDGKQILDHEICILNGDLNYRIDTIPRNNIIRAIAENDLAKLLERDQLNVSRRRVAGFRLAPFTELPITFPPTYKYDVGSDRYDSSDKKRAPAWCDRLLYRSSTGRVKQLEYRRHENVFYSDHRPVSGIFRITVKKVDEVKRRATLKSVNADFVSLRRMMLEEGCVGYLVGSFGLKKEEAKRLIRGAK